MKAFAIQPGAQGSGRVRDFADAQPNAGEVKVRSLLVGIDGTDRELIEGRYGEAPPGSDFLITGHEALGRIMESAPGQFASGQLVVPIVRRPDPEPCLNCAAGEWDMCLNGGYIERGIKGAHGFLSEHFVEEPAYLVPIPDSLATTGVLLEPTSIVEKAIEQTERIQDRLRWEPTTALVLGAGAIGTIACLMLSLRGLNVHLYSKAEGGKGRLIAEAAGARFHSADERSLDHRFAAEIGPIDLVIEATGYSPLAFQAIDVVGPNGVVCLTGVSAGTRTLEIDSSHLNLEMVLSNRVMFGTVNANRRHYERGVEDLLRVERRWPGLLAKLITQRVRLEEFGLGPARQDNLKLVVEVGTG